VGTSLGNAMANQPPRLHQTLLAPSIQFLPLPVGARTVSGKLRHLPYRLPPAVCQPNLATGLARLAGYGVALPSRPATLAGVGI